MRQVHCCLLALCLAGATSLFAQEFRGTITGQVTDHTGGVVPKVTVTAQNTDTNVATSTVTNGSGAYSIPFLQPGRYSVSAGLAGFKKAMRQVEIRVGDRLMVDLKLEVTDVQTSVQVGADSTPLLDTVSATLGSVVDG